MSTWTDITASPFIVNQHMLAGARKKGMSEYEAAVDLASRRLHPVPTHVRSATGKIRPIAVTQLPTTWVDVLTAHPAPTTP